MGNESLPIPLVIFVLMVLITSILFAGAMAIVVLVIGGPPAVA
jgi:hypothetical protein